MRDRISPALESLGWLDVLDLIIRHDCISVFLALGEPHAPLAIRSLFSHRADVSQRGTRVTVMGELELPALHLSVTSDVFLPRCLVLEPPAAATAASLTQSEFVAVSLVSLSDFRSWHLAHFWAFIQFLSAFLSCTFYCVFLLSFFIFTFMHVLLCNVILYHVIDLNQTINHLWNDS